MTYGATALHLFRTILSLNLIVSLVACTAGAAPSLPTQTVPPPLVATPPEILPHTRWIEISLQEYMLRLHDGERTIAQYRVATGVGTSLEYTTYPGVFELTLMYRGPVETAPGVFVTDVLEFDPFHGNGIHSLPKDKDGHILDDRVGAALTAGCVRVAEAAAVFDFATLGMIIWVH